jgi:hypothetical protein
MDIAKVASSGGIRRKAIIKPLASPTTVPASNAIIQLPGIGSSRELDNIIAVPFTRAIIFPVDMSMPPETIITIWDNEARISGRLLLNNELRLAVEKNLGPCRIILSINAPRSNTYPEIPNEAKEKNLMTNGFFIRRIPDSLLT